MDNLLDDLDDQMSVADMKTKSVSTKNLNVGMTISGNDGAQDREEEEEEEARITSV